MRKPLFSLIACLVVMCTFAQSKEDLERDRKKIQQEIAELQKTQSLIQKDKKANLAQLAVIKEKIKKRNAVINNINNQVELIDNNIFSNNREIYRLRKQLDTLKVQYANTLVYAYQNRSNYDMINFLFSSVSFNDAIRRVQYLKSYRGYREQQVESIRQTQKELAVKIDVLSKNKQEKSQILVEQQQEVKTLEEDRKEQDAYMARLKAREKELAKELAAKQRVAKSLQNAIAAIIIKETKAAAAKAKKDAEEKAAKNLAAKTNTVKASGSGAEKPVGTVNAPVERKYNVLENTPEVTKVSVDFEQNRRNLPWPVDKGQISSPFGRRKIEGTSLYEDNQWITIATQQAANVKAVFEGVVTTVYDVQGSQTVTVKHGKYFTTYYNLSSVMVNKGDAVKMGQIIGKAGVNDDGDGEILFVVNMESKFLDPELWLKPR